MAEAAPAIGLARWTPSLPSNLVQMLNPFAAVDGDASKAQVGDTAKQSSTTEQTSYLAALRRPILSAVAYTSNPSQQSSPSRSEPDMYSEPGTPTPSDSGSRTNSVDGSRRSRKRPKTSYNICHAPPASTARQRLHRRPRPLIQLHRKRANSRPIPAFEVIPSTNFSVRLQRTITTLYKARHAVCPNDLVVVEADNYDGDEADEEQERNVIGLICKGRRDDERLAGGKARICLADGREWEAYPTLSGAYELFATDEHGLGSTLRWVPKKYKDGGKPANGLRTFNFSTIAPNSRRHPVIATLSSETLDISDTYKLPDPAAATPLSTPRQGSTVLSDTLDEEGDADMCETEDELREIITMSAIWVAFKEGWSPNFQYDDREAFSPNSPTRSATNIVPDSPGSPVQAPLEKRTSIKSIGSGIMRGTSLLGRGNRNSAASVPEENLSQTLNRSTSAAQRTGRVRADSASTVLVHRAASNRRKNNQASASWRSADLLSAENKLPEASKEDLARDARSPTPAASQAKQKSSVAQPLIPPADSHDSSSSGNPTPRAGTDQDDFSSEEEDSSSEEGAEDNAEGQRHSSGNSSSRAAANAKSVAPPAPPRRRRKRSIWRRLLCGGGAHDV